MTFAPPTSTGIGTTYTVTADATGKAAAEYIINLKITSDLHPTLTSSSMSFKVKVNCGTLDPTTFVPNPATAGSATYTIPALAATSMPAAETITIPSYDQATSAAVACTYVETVTFEVDGVVNDLSAYANWFTASGKTVTLVVSEGNRAAVNSQRLTVTVVNTLDDLAKSVNKGYTFTVTALRAECDNPTTITFTAITFTDPLITVLTGASSTGTFNDAGYTLSANTASEVCGPRTYVI